MLADNSTHDWSVPGAQMDAQVDCWCRHNLTQTIEGLGCCDATELYPMCSVNCTPDCSSQLAQNCTQECPSMCFEAAEYAVDSKLCDNCDWAKCWSVMKCLTSYAEARVQNGSLSRTCHETDFAAGAELRSYWECWRNAPKHSSHWNVLSAVVHCVCREGMVGHTRDEHCCDSLVYGGGICDLQCLSEAACNAPEAQTCIHNCQQRCPTFAVAPSTECLKTCLSKDAPCRRYAACRPVSVRTHICDDGRWPEASSGCCLTNRSEGQHLGCPRLCEAQHLWRSDSSRALPWWSRYNPGQGIIAQCTCQGCPESTEEGEEKLQRTVADSLWDNGQIMLIDIARRAGLQHGANRRMQELMVQRNEAIMRALEATTSQGTPEAGAEIAAINLRFTDRITDAAQYGDDPLEEPPPRSGPPPNVISFAIVAGACTCALLLVVCVASVLILRRRKLSPVTEYVQNQQVVIGNPVGLNTAVLTGNAVTGAPVTVAASTRGACATELS